jgi:ketosteroid isomerase-like protein
VFHPLRLRLDIFLMRRTVNCSVLLTVDFFCSFMKHASTLQSRAEPLIRDRTKPEFIPAGSNTVNRRSTLALISTAFVWLWIAFSVSNAVAQSAGDVEGVKEASKNFYAALAVLDNGEAMEKVWAHTPYVTYVGPRHTSVLVGWDAQKKYWPEANGLFTQRNVTLSDQHIHVNGNLAWEMGQETGEQKMKDGRSPKLDYLVTNVYENIDGKWLIVSHHVQPKPQ